MDDDQLIDLIYEAAVIPEKWPVALAAVSSAVDGAFASLVTIPAQLGPTGDSSKVNQMRWTGTPQAETLIAQFSEVREPAIVNSRVARGYARRLPGFFDDFDLFESHELDADPFYRDFLRPRGYGWFAGTIIDSPTGDSAIVSVERSYARGPIEPEAKTRLDTFRPHLARAAFLALRLGLQRAREMIDALARLGLGAAVLRPGGTVLVANALFEAMESDVARLSRRRLELCDARADDLLAQALARLRAAHSASKGAVQSIPLAAQAGWPPLIIHIIPIKGAAHEIFQQAEAVVIVTRVEPRLVPNASVLQGLFDLTPAEARVASHLGNGDTIDEIAQKLVVSPHTVRAQVRAVMAKTGMHRQTDLARLLAGASLLA